VDVASESSGSEDLDDDDVELGSDDEDAVGPAVPATTLTTTLVQALHSQDGPLLESCLAHSNHNLVRSTVKRLPSGGLVLSLLEAIVDRLGKQKKGREGLASPKRARALVGWLRETLVVHVGFLVTVPSLVSRLAALHASLTQRLALQQPLLALQGRLELVMSQIDLRQDRARAQTARSGAKAIKAAPTGRRYVEGESTDDEDEQLGEGLEGDEDSEGDVEDVVLGPGGDDDDESGDSDGFGEIDDDDVDSDFDDDEEDGEGSKVPRHKVRPAFLSLSLQLSTLSSFLAEHRLPVGDEHALTPSPSPARSATASRRSWTSRPRTTTTLTRTTSRSTVTRTCRTTRRPARTRSSRRESRSASDGRRARCQGRAAGAHGGREG